MEAVGRKKVLKVWGKRGQNAGLVWFGQKGGRTVSLISASFQAPSHGRQTDTFKDTHFIKSTAKVQQNHAITLNNMGHDEKTPD